MEKEGKKRARKKRGNDSETSIEVGGIILREMLLVEKERTGGLVSFETIEVEVNTGDDAMLAENHLDGLAGQFGMVVFVAEVAKAHLTETRSSKLGNGLSAVAIGEMAVFAEDTILEVLWVRPFD